MFKWTRGFWKVIGFYTFYTLTTDDISDTESYPEEMVSNEVQEKFAKLGRNQIPTALSEGDIEVPSSSRDELSEGYNSTYPYDGETMESSKILKELQHEPRKGRNKKKGRREKGTMLPKRRRGRGKKQRPKPKRKWKALPPFVMEWPRKMRSVETRLSQISKHQVRKVTREPMERRKGNDFPTPLLVT